MIHNIHILYYKGLINLKTILTWVAGTARTPGTT